MSHPHPTRRGFTLVEVMISVSILVLVLAGLIGFLVSSWKLWHPSTIAMGVNLKGSYASSRAVYGMSRTNNGLRGAGRTTVGHWSDGDSWTITFNSNRWVLYNGVSNTLVDSAAGVLARDVVSSTATVSATGCTLSFDVMEQSGGLSITNRYQTTVTFRN